MKYQVGGWLTAMVIAMVLGPGLAYAFETYMPALIDRAGMNAVSVAHNALAARIITSFPVALVSACWVGSVARRKQRNIFLWVIFALVTDLLGVAIFFGIVAYQRTLDAREGPAWKSRTKCEFPRGSLASNDHEGCRAE